MSKHIFCDKCGKILQIKTDNNKVHGICNCGFSGEITPLIFKDKSFSKQEETGKGVAKKPKTLGFPHVCIKCKYKECDLEVIGAPYSDESDIYLYKCKKCGFIERQADGSGNK